MYVVTTKKKSIKLAIVVGFWVDIEICRVPWSFHDLKVTNCWQGEKEVLLPILWPAPCKFVHCKNVGLGTGWACGSLRSAWRELVQEKQRAGSLHDMVLGLPEGRVSSFSNWVIESLLLCDFLFAIDSFCSGSMARFVRGTMLANESKGQKVKVPKKCHYAMGRFGKCS